MQKSKPKKRNDHLLAHLVREAEKAIIVQYIAKAGGNKSRAAKALGVTHRHLQRRCVALGISDLDIQGGNVGVVIVGGT
jgi:transcriptional regulator with PAS, ATPase and Fis domain